MRIKIKELCCTGKQKKATRLLCIWGLSAFVSLSWACSGADGVQVQKEADLLQGESDDDSALEDAKDMAEESGEGRIVVHILGAVVLPGVYELSEQSRVIDAIKSAGGYTDDACVSWLNQARPLEDGEQIYVPTEEEVKRWKESGDVDAPVETGMETTQSEKNAKLNINKATVEELMNLPGIGESKARSIVDYRQQIGKFSCIEDLMNVPGIKEGVYNQIKDLIQV